MTPRVNVLPAIQEIEDSLVTEIRPVSAIFRDLLKDDGTIKNFLNSRDQISSREFNQILYKFPSDVGVIRESIKKKPFPDKADLALIQQFADRFAGSLQSVYRNAYSTLFDRMISQRDPANLIEYLKDTKALESSRFQRIIRHKSGNQEVMKLSVEKLRYPSVSDINLLALVAISYPPRTASYQFYEELETLLFNRFMGLQPRIGFISAMKDATGQINRFNSDMYHSLLNRVLFLAPTTTHMDDDLLRIIVDASLKVTYPRLGDVKFVHGWIVQMEQLKKTGEAFALSRVLNRFMTTIAQRELHVLPCGDYCNFPGL